MMKSLKSKLILITLTLVVVPLVITNLFHYMFVTEQYAETIEEKNRAFAASLSTSVTAYMKGSFDVINEIADEPEVAAFDVEAQKSALERAVLRIPQYELLYIQGMDGMQTARSEGTLSNRKDRWWFEQLREKQTSFISKAYYSVFSNAPVTSIFAPITSRKGETVGYIGADILVDELQALVKRNSLGKGSYSFIIDGEGTVVAHPDKLLVQEMYNFKLSTKMIWRKDQNGQNLKDDKGNEVTEVQPIDVDPALSQLTKNVLQGESGTGSFEDSNHKLFVAAYTPIRLPGASDHWAVITVQDEQEAYSFVYDLQAKVLWLSLGLAGIASLIIWVFSSLLLNPIVRLMQIMGKAAQGDLTHRSPYRSKDEIGRLTESYNKMMDNIGASLKDIKAAFSRVSTASSVLAETTRETSLSINEAAASVARVVESGNGQYDHAIKSLRLSGELAEAIAQMAAEMERCDRISEEAAAFKHEKLPAADDFERSSESRSVGLLVAADVVEAFRSNVANLEHMSKELARAASLAAQLALEEQSGRALDEIRKTAAIALQVGRFVDAMVTALREDTEKAQQWIADAKLAALEQQEAAAYASGALLHISRSVANVQESVGSTVNQLKLVREKREQLSMLITNIVDESRQVSDVSMTISAETEQQAAAMDEISHLSDSLNNGAKIVSERIKSFRLD